MKTHAWAATLPSLLLAACAAAPVPPALDPGADQAWVATLSATGVQVYECRRGSAGAPPSWVFVAPEARLFDGRGQAVGSHGAGPHWLADDGSRLQGSVKARADAPAAGDIPWLLLAASASGPAGRFSGISSIQRVNTRGGVAPAGGCEADGVARVPYTADYRLFNSADSRHSAR